MKDAKLIAPHICPLPRQVHVHVSTTNLLQCNVLVFNTRLVIMLSPLLS